MMPSQAPLEIPAALVFEVVITLGVSAWAWSLARAGGQPPLRWAALTMVGAFVVHRLAGAIYLATSDPNDVFSTGGQLWRLIGPFLGTITVFVVTPIVLGKLIPSTPRIPRRK